MFLTIIITTCIIVWSATIIMFILFKKWRNEAKLNLPVHWIEYTNALEKKDIDKINHFGSLVVWNENTKREQKIAVYEDVNLLYKENPELIQLWKDSHYLVYGIEPVYNNVSSPKNSTV
jgi:hypothetical protein